MGHPHIVKRKGHTEPYDNHKVYGSCYAACLNAHCAKEEAKGLCEKVTQKLDRWIDEKKEVGSGEIFRETARAIRELNQKAAFMYETHRDIS